MTFVVHVVPARPHLFFKYRTRHVRQLLATKNGVDGPDPRQKYLDDAALDYAKGIEAGLTPDEIVRLQMGVQSEDELSDVQRRYKAKVITKLEARAAELKKQSDKCADFEAGKSAYGRGAYPISCQLLEKAALENAEDSILGGDIRLWLALTYQALGRTEDCVALFKRLEQTHPNKKTRKQAKNLLYIMQAPKLKIGEDERVKLPILKDLDRAEPRLSFSRTRSRLPSRPRAPREKMDEESFWESYRPPVFLQNRYVQAAFLAIALCLVVYFNVYRPR